MKNHFIILIDTSWSMRSHLGKIVNGLNSFVQKLKSYKDMFIYLTVALFSEKVKYICKEVYVHELNMFSEEQIYCHGTTKLYDSIGYVLGEWLLSPLEFNTLFILSDGADNCSKLYSESDIIEICKNAENSGIWSIIHCNTNVLALNVTNSIKFDIENIQDVLENLRL